MTPVSSDDTCIQIFGSHRRDSPAHRDTASFRLPIALMLLPSSSKLKRGDTSPSSSMTSSSTSPLPFPTRAPLPRGDALPRGDELPRGDALPLPPLMVARSAAMTPACSSFPWSTPIDVMAPLICDTAAASIAPTEQPFDRSPYRNTSIKRQHFKEMPILWITQKATEANH